MTIPLRMGTKVYLLLSLVHLACAGSRAASVERTEPEEARLLVIRDAADGSHDVSWQSSSELTQAQVDWASARAREFGPTELTASRTRDCDKEHIECFRRCWKRKPPYPSERGDAGHNSHCRETCLEAYQDCLARNKLQALRFTTMSEAIDWVKRHRQELLVGTLVVAAGVTFIVVSAGAGILVLAPVVMMTQGDSALDFAVCEG